MTKTISTTIDIIAALIIVMIGYQYWGSGETADQPVVMILIAMVMVAACGWIAKAITGPITRAIDNTMSKEK